jgi:hypothetical protein
MKPVSISRMSTAGFSGDHLGEQLQGIATSATVFLVTRLSREALHPNQILHQQL